jgi:hypothetical protein
MGVAAISGVLALMCMIIFWDVRLKFGNESQKTGEVTAPLGRRLSHEKQLQSGLCT